MNRKKVRIILLSFSFMLIGTVAFAEKEPPLPNKPGQSAVPPPPGLPIDGGLSLLLASGIAYGIYSLKRKKK
jgi:hypothetical protein